MEIRVPTNLVFASIGIPKKLKKRTNDGISFLKNTQTENPNAFWPPIQQPRSLVDEMKTAFSPSVFT